MQAEDDDDEQEYRYSPEIEELDPTYQVDMKKYAPDLRNHETIRDFTHLRKAGDFADALLRVGRFAYPVHRNILSCCSPYFRAMFTHMANMRMPLFEPCRSHSLESVVTSTNVSVDDLQFYNGGSSSSSDVFPRTQNTGDLTWIDYYNRRVALIGTPPRRFRQSSPSVDTRKYEFPMPCSSSQTSPELRDDVAPFTLHRYFNTLPSSISSSEECCHSSSYDPRPAVNQLQPLGTIRYEVTLSDVDPKIVNDIIEHAYGGKVIISVNNVEQLLLAADRFQITSLLMACCEFLRKQLSVSNCISIVKFASHFYQCDTLREHGTRFLLDNFTTVFKTSPEFEKLTCKELVSILKADQLNAKYEELVLDSIIRWVIADVTERQIYIPELVHCTRVGLMLPDNMREFVDSWLLCSNGNREFSTVTLKVMESVLQLQKQQMDEVDGAMFSPRLPRDVMFVIGGSNFGFPLNLVEAFDCRTWLWSIICPYEFAPRSYHGMVALDKEIYIIGGFSGQVYLSSCCKFKPETLTWENLTPMNTRRCYVGVVELKGYIYAVGGYDGAYRLNSAERFKKSTNQWSFIAPMSNQRSDAGVAVLDDKLYVCGGFNGTECIKAVEMYDSDTDYWCEVPCMPQGRSGLGVVAHDSRLYAVGGFDGSDSSVRLNTMECYCPQIRQWTTLKPMPHPRSNLAVEVLEDVLYAIGGYSGDRTTSIVECYDFSSNIWYQSTRLSHNRSALGVCVISGLSNAAEILKRDRTALPQRIPPLEY